MTMPAYYHIGTQGGKPIDLYAILPFLAARSQLGTFEWSLWAQCMAYMIRINNGKPGADIASDIDKIIHNLSILKASVHKREQP